MIVEEERLRFVVTDGGEPTDEEFAALAVALREIAEIRAAEVASRTAEQSPAAWHQAALLEGVGGRPALSAADLEELADRS